MCGSVCTCVSVCECVCNNYRAFSKGSEAGPLQAGQQQFSVSSAVFRGAAWPGCAAVPRSRGRQGSLGLLGAPSPGGWAGTGPQPEARAPSLSVQTSIFCFTLCERLWRLHERLPTGGRYLKVTAVTWEGQLVRDNSRCDPRPLTPC